MLPYHLLQLGYVAIAGGLAAGLWWASARALPATAPNTLRFATSFVLALVSALVGYVILVNLLGRDISSGFMPIAWAFYAGCFWLPGLALLRALRHPAGALRGRVAELGLPLLCLSTGFWSVLGEPNRLQVRFENVPVAEWPSDAPPLRIVHLSDLQTVGANSREARVVEIVRDLEPDVVVFTGDYLAGPFFDTEPALEAARELVHGLTARLGVVAVGGHSENHLYRLRIFEGSSVAYLTNQVAEWELDHGRSLAILGLDSRREDLRALDEPVTPGEVRIVASHVPDVSIGLSGRGVDLHLAGHTHGGQVAIPGIGAPWTLSSVPRRLARGLHRFGDHWIDVSAGIGMEGNHAPRIRLFCPPEISVLDLHGTGPALHELPGVDG